VKRGHVVVALAVAGATALVMLSLVAWMTSGSYNPNHVRWLSLALVLPMVIAENIGFERPAALALAFCTYFAVLFGCLAWYIISAGPGRKERGR
jgi:hypothetical protein